MIRSFCAVLILSYGCAIGLAEGSSFNVVNTNDSGGGSLRQAIINANNNAGADTIQFLIPGVGVQTITPLTPLPMITDAVTIDGYTQPTASANTLANGDNAKILIVINGATVEAGQGLLPGLQIAASNCTVRGLAINTFFVQILVSSGSGNLISGNFLGTDATGTMVPGTGNESGRGVEIDSPNNIIGGTAAAARNVISVHGNCIEVAGSGTGATGTLIQGNFVGTDHTGTVGFLANAGIHNNGVDMVTIGGTAAGAGNIVAGCGGDGIPFNGNNGVIQGNFVGTDVTGTKALGNNQGVNVSGNNCLIGGATAAARNVISGNRNRGIGLQGTFSGDMVQGNYIGVDVTGTKALGNGNDGIAIFSGDPNNHLIGGLTATPGTSPGNIISGNTNSGIDLIGTRNNLVQGNTIGADKTGTVALGNTLDGININGGSTGNMIGGTAANSGNIIAFNGSGSLGDGIHVPDPGSINNSIEGNSIFQNNALGIDLGNDGITPNDQGDGDGGPNNLQNFPVLETISSGGGMTTVTGRLNSAANTIYRIEFFANDPLDPTGYGEGKIFLLGKTVMTNSSGNASFGQGFPQLTDTQFVTSTATDPDGNTSEFSGAVGQLLNVSTRMKVLTGNSVLIGGFIVGGTGTKDVVVRALGPTLTQLGVIGALADPTLDLRNGSTSIATNDNWKSTQQAEIMATGRQPPNDLEPAIRRSLAPGNYTAIVSGKNNATGVALVEAYDVDKKTNPTLTNISTRGFVDVGQNVMIGGFISGNGIVKVIVRVLGPTLTQFGVTNVLADPVLDVRDAQGTSLATNDNWKDTQQAEIVASGKAPPNDKESAVIIVRPAGNTTAIVTGKGNTTGNALVEAYILPP